MDWFHGYIESMKEYLGDVVAESDKFREAVKSNWEPDLDVTDTRTGHKAGNKKEN